MRIPQLKENPKGSQKWLQKIINTCPEILNAHIVEKLPSLSDRKICWLSPLEKDEFAEYRDAAFLQRLGLPGLGEELKHFWPKRGPQWDALGKTSDGQIYILIEAKANVPELVSFCGAKEKDSLKTISESLNETQQWLNCREPCIDWKYGFYQYANRLAHLYFLIDKAHLETYLIFIYIVQDSSHIPTSQEAWGSALKIQKKLMGLSTKNLTDKVIELFININEIKLNH